MRLRLTATLAVIVATLGAGVESAAACSCVLRSPGEKLAAATGAFNGRLLEVTPAGAFEAVFRYRIGQVFKGKKRLRRGRIVNVRSGSNDGVCGLPQETGVVYGMLVRREAGHWSGNSCSVLSPGSLRRAARKARSSAVASASLCG